MDTKRPQGDKNKDTRGNLSLTPIARANSNHSLTPS